MLNPIYSPQCIIGISFNLQYPRNSLPLPHTTQGIYSLSLLNSPLDIFFPLVLFNVDKKSPIYCMLSENLLARTILGSQASKE
jgi:hypothetical protein